MRSRIKLYAAECGLSTGPSSLEQLEKFAKLVADDCAKQSNLVQRAEGHKDKGKTATRITEITEMTSSWVRARYNINE